MGAYTAILVAVLAVVVCWLGLVIRKLDVGKVVLDHHPGPCHLVGGVEHGAEDIEILPDGTALITSGLKMSPQLVEMLSDRKGQLFLFDFRSPEKAAAVEIVGFTELHTFNPHGVSSWTDASGITTVFVVNHPLDVQYDRIEQFHWDAGKKTLTHIASITDDVFRNTNDLVATSDSSFYITNFRYSRGELARTVESLSCMLAWGEVVYYDGQTARVVASGLHLPNGVALSPDNKFLYVAESLGKRLTVYSRQQNNSLQLLHSTPLGTLPDNLYVHPDSGDLWIGCHPIVWQLLQFDRNPTTGTAPSQVLRIQMKGGDIQYIEEVMADSGRRLYGSTTAVYHQGKLLIGTVIHKLMYCDVRHLGP